MDISKEIIEVVADLTQEKDISRIDSKRKKLKRAIDLIKKLSFENEGLKAILKDRRIHWEITLPEDLDNPGTIEVSHEPV